jgi:ABC-type multidrug transport system fused ATPase/permease subunit
MFEGSFQMAQIAVVTTSAAVPLIPTAGPIAVDMYKAQCDPAAFYAGHEVWDQVKTTLDEAAREVQETIAKVTEDEWSGADRQAFEEKLADYKEQLDAAAFLANAISVILLVVAWALFIYIAMMVMVAAFIAALVVYILAMAAATLSLGAGGAVAQATSMVGSLYTGVWEPITKALEVLLNAFAVILGGSLFADIGMQMMSGNLGAARDFGFAQVPAADVIWRGTLNRAERKVTADLASGGLSTGTTALPGIPNFTRMLPIPFQLGGAAKGVGDTATGGQLVTGGLVNRDNDRVG